MKPTFPRLFVACGLAGLLSACGGTGVGPSPLPTPTATPVNTRPVMVTTFLDENGNGVLDAGEGVRIPNVEIVAGSARATSGVLSGQATLQLADGPQTLTVTAASLPPFYRPPAPISITVPTTGPVLAPITLPRGSNQATLYMGFGDSITNGEAEVPDGSGYRNFLTNLLRAHFGAAEIANEGRDGTNSDRGALRIGESLSRVRPAFTLIYYGTNDWNQCSSSAADCYTTASLRSMVQQINRSGSHAFLATLMPVNVGYDDRAPASRNEWVAEENVFIRQVADQEGAVVVDLNTAYFKSGLPNSALFVDHIHPTTAGYQIMAQTWFDAITKAYSRILSDF